MSDPTPSSLLDDLEAIKKSLNKIAETKPQIPTLEEIVGTQPPKAVNPQNPFLASKSLSELIQIRNEAEARAAQEMAKLKPVKSVDEILANSMKVPDPEEIIQQMETLFDTWVEHSVSQYLEIFESELRNRLQQDFQNLVSQWYQEHELPLPKAFEEKINQQTDESDEETPPSE